MSEASYNHLMPDDPPQKPVGWGISPDAQAIFNQWFQAVENADTYIPLEAQDSLVAAIALALTEQAQEIERLRATMLLMEKALAEGRVEVISLQERIRQLPYGVTWKP